MIGRGNILKSMLTPEFQEWKAGRPYEMGQKIDLLTVQSTAVRKYILIVFDQIPHSGKDSLMGSLIDIEKPLSLSPMRQILAMTRNCIASISPNVAGNSLLELYKEFPDLVSDLKQNLDLTERRTLFRYLIVIP